MAIIISILMSLGILSNSANTNNNHSYGYHETKGDNYAANSKGSIDWEEMH